MTRYPSKDLLLANRDHKSEYVIIQQGHVYHVPSDEDGNMTLCYLKIVSRRVVTRSLAIPEPACHDCVKIMNVRYPKEVTWVAK